MTETIYRLDTVEEVQFLRDTLAPIVGQLCWQASLIYWQELVLDIGPEIPRIIPPNKGRGAWRLTTYGTDWSLLVDGIKVTDSSQDSDAIEPYLPKIQNVAIQHFNIACDDLRLTLHFANNCQVSICPTPEDNALEAIYWSWLTPARRALQIGPGRKWSIAE